MKLPSIAFIADQSLRTFSRFPFAILSAVIGTSAVLMLAQEDFSEHHAFPWLFNAAAAGFLGISLLTFTQLWAERYSLAFREWLILHLAIAGALIVYAYMLPENVFLAPMHHMIRYALIVLAIHLFVAVGPFIGHGSVGSFWKFNESLLLRILSSAVYSGVLYVGLTIALLAVDNLFNADIRPIRYAQLWWFLAGIFNTWFFLSGVPRLSDLRGDTIDYPKGLKVFTQYVLIPLVTIYVAILYAYMVKIVIDWDWPEGWVGYLVLGFSTSGIFTLLLLHPIKDALDNSWMAAITRRFYVVILPPSVLLLLAIWRRISEYGLTENRFFVVVLGIWLIGISLYFLLSTRQSIKVIPLSLGIIALASSVGPWSASSISRWNQMERLELVLRQNDLLADGQIRKAGAAVSYEDAQQISSVMRYLVDVHGTTVLQPWFPNPIDSMEGIRDTGDRQVRDVAHALVSSIGIEYVPELRQRAGRRVEQYTFTPDRISLELSEYSFFHAGETLGGDRNGSVFEAGGSTWMVLLDADSARLDVRKEARSKHPGGSVVLDLAPVIRSLVPDRSVAYRTVQVGGDSLIVTGRAGSIGAAAFLRKLVLERDASGVNVTSVTFDLFLRD